MDMKNIPPEVGKWFFAQEESFAIIHNHIEGQLILVKNGSEIWELYKAYKDGWLLGYLGYHGYTEHGEPIDMVELDDED